MSVHCLLTVMIGSIRIAMGIGFAEMVYVSGVAWGVNLAKKQIIT